MMLKILVLVVVVTVVYLILREAFGGDVKFIKAQNNSGRTLYRTVVNGKVWTASSKKKLKEMTENGSR